MFLRVLVIFFFLCWRACLGRLWMRQAHLSARGFSGGEDASISDWDSLTGVEESFINSLSIHTATTLVQTNMLFHLDSFPRLIRYLCYLLLVTPVGALKVGTACCPCLTFFSGYMISYGKYKIFTFTYKTHIISPLADSHPLPLCPSLSTSWPSSFPNALASSLPQDIWTHHSLSLTHSSAFQNKRTNKMNEPSHLANPCSPFRSMFTCRFPGEPPLMPPQTRMALLLYGHLFNICLALDVWLSVQHLSSCINCWVPWI